MLLIPDILSKQNKVGKEDVCKHGPRGGVQSMFHFSSNNFTFVLRVMAFLVLEMIKPTLLGRYGEKLS